MVVNGEAERGIVLGGSGNGEAMVANRIRGIRCALCWNVESARLARQHNDANMISPRSTDDDRTTRAGNRADLAGDAASRVAATSAGSN